MSLIGDWLTWGAAALAGYTASRTLPVPAPEEDPYAQANARAVAKQQEFGQGWLTNLLGGLRTKSGEKVSPDNSISVAAVYACIKVLSEDFAKMPVELYRRTRDGGQERVFNHPVARLLNMPSPYVNRFRFRQIVESSRLLYGGGFAVIQRDVNGIPRELIPLTYPPTPMVTDGDLFWHITVFTDWDRARFEGIPSGIVRDEDMLRISGWSMDTIRGVGIPVTGREPIGTQMATEEHAARFFSNGTQFGGTLEHPGRLSDHAKEGLRSSINQAHQGVDQAFKFLLLQEGLKFNMVGTDAEKAQLTESRRFGVEEMARLFRVPPYKIMDFSRATFTNAEEVNIGYADDTLMPGVENWEASMDMRLLSQRDRDAGLFTQIDLASLKRANLDTQTKAAQTLTQSGLITVNEARQRLGMNPVEGGDVFLRPVNLAPVPEGEDQESAEEADAE